MGFHLMARPTAFLYTGSSTIYVGQNNAQAAFFFARSLLIITVSASPYTVTTNVLELASE